MSDSPDLERSVAAQDGVFADELGALNDHFTGPGVLKELNLSLDSKAAQLLAGGKRKRSLEAAAAAREDLIASKRFWR